MENLKITLNTIIRPNNILVVDNINLYSDYLSSNCNDKWHCSNNIIIGKIIRLDFNYSDINTSLYPSLEWGINFHKLNFRFANRDERILYLTQQLNQRREEQRNQSYEQHAQRIERNIIGGRRNRELRESIEGPRILGRIQLDEGKKEEKIPVKIPKQLPIYNGYKKEVLDCILNTPSKISILKANTINRMYHDKIINSFLPYKIGIEIECNESLSRNINLSKEDLKKKLNCVDYSDDNVDNFCEHRLCFNGHKQITALYSLCTMLTNNCTLNLNGSIHYHFDMPECYQMKYDKRIKLTNILTKKLDAIDEILLYKGKYNHKEVNYNQKGIWVNIRNYEGLNTIEIRTSAPKFDYKEIVREIILLSEIITEVRTKMNFKKYRL